MTTIAPADTGQFSIIELSDALAQAPVRFPVVLLFEDGRTCPPGELMSYRGYYDHLAITAGTERVSATVFRQFLVKTIGKKMFGYKGGEYEMTRHTPVWVSEHGSVSGKTITSVTIAAKQVILEVGPIGGGDW